jgi:hypothetical protein
MQITFKILLDKRYIKKNETYNLKLRIYQDGDYKECSLGILRRGRSSLPGFL